MLNLAIIGCGQIGSRHLQALSLLEGGAAIHLVDPSQDSLALCQARFAETVTPGKYEKFCLFLHSHCQELPQTLDAAIIASGSMQRARLCQDLLAASTPRFLLLEKFLFPRAAEYAQVLDLSKAERVPTYVNQWLATTPSFHKILSNLGISIDLESRSCNRHGPVKMRVWGTGWGLCCNAVHYLEPFQLITGNEHPILSEAAFSPGFVESKRNGYRELLGHLRFNARDGSRLELACEDGPPADFINIEIEHQDNHVHFDFFLDCFECTFRCGGKSWEESLPIPRQSQSTHVILETFLQTGVCGLPDLSTSSAQHLLVLNPFLDHFRKYNSGIGDICPIT
jgi:predicted dehydrogenase